MTARLLALDTPIWIAFIEQKTALAAGVNPIFEDLRAGRVRAVTSTVTLIEVLTGALLRGDEHLARRIETVFMGLEGASVVPVTTGVAVRAAGLRAAYRLRTPDAVHLATAIEAEASAFVTTDRRLARVKDIEVQVVRPSPSRAR